MIANTALLLAGLFGVLLVTPDGTVAKSHCCVKRAYCCTLQSRCCKGTLATAEATVAASATPDEVELAKQFCCAKRAYCCKLKRRCCPTATAKIAGVTAPRGGQNAAADVAASRSS